MSTLQQVEQAILGLSQIELERLQQWFTELMEWPRRIAEPAPRRKPEFGERMTFDEYLDYSSEARARYEYVAGELFAMSGTTRRHNRIAGRLFRVFEDHLKGKGCEIYMSDVLVKVRASRDDHGYYPDVMVVCGQDRGDERFVTSPKLIVEVLSPSTANVDRREKRYNYACIEELEEYVIVAQDAPEVTVFRRADRWQPTVVESLGESVELRSLGLTVPLAQVYEGEQI
ncbi:MAG: Uma2 family endonuclease [Steroidobacteraceae bacterium]